MQVLQVRDGLELLLMRARADAQPNREMESAARTCLAIDADLAMHQLH